MRLYTIQKEFKWLEFQKTGILVADNDIICDESFVDSYSWLEDKMGKLLPTSEINVKHPVWAWYKFGGKNKPDLRKSGHIEKGEIGYRIEFEIEEEKVLLSDFSNWHLILNASEDDRKVKYFDFCPLNEVDEEDIPGLIEEGFEIINNHLIFNWDKVLLDKTSKRLDIQATMWCVHMSQVINVDKFKSR